MSEEYVDEPDHPVLASLTKYIPHDGIAHAGGQYVQTHYEVLRSTFRIREIAPDTQINRSALDARGADDAVTLLPGRGLLRSGRFKHLGDLESAWAGSSVTRNIRTAFAHDDAVWQRLRDADIVEFQWSEMLALAPRIRERMPRTPLVGIAHDVITQRWERAAAESSWPLTAAYRLAAHRSRPRESHSFDVVDALVVFSEKDAQIVERLAPRARVEVVLPGLGPEPGESQDREPDPAEPMVLFTGALSRADNHNAVVWFLEQVWPRVLAEVPAASFVAAGAGPRSSLQRLVEHAPRASLTGFVDSLEPYYARASVFVAPIFTGAGVKFKTIDALLRGVPTVATPVGIEGIGAPDLFQGVTTDPAAFADYVVATLRNPDTDRSQRAALWADRHYGRAAYRSRILTLYAELLSERAGAHTPSDPS